MTTMLKLRALRNERRGAVLPLTAVLIIFLFGLIAFAVDLGWIMAVHTQMQSAADSAALAGAAQLLDNTYLKGTGATNTGTATNSAMGNANTAAKNFAAKNMAGGVSISLAANQTQADDQTLMVNASTGDIVCGYLARPSNQSSSMNVSTPSVGPYPNSVQVTVHRDNVRNGALGLFFAPVLGITGWNLQAKATATYEGGISGFQIHSNGASTCKLLPFALEVHTWSNDPSDPWYDATLPGGVLQGNGQDNFTRDPSSSNVTAGQSDGIYECQLFPLSNGQGNGSGGLQPGNFGTVDIGSPSNSNDDIKRQIQYGPNAQDLSYFPGGKLQIDPTTGMLQLYGDTGISAGVDAAFQSILGQPRIIPLYSSVSGNGNNATYTIVAFAGCTVLECVLSGSLSGKHITIQPCWCIDGNALGGGTGNNSFFVVKPLALTR
jgi:Flp pilus assembly protein TadG